MTWPLGIGPQRPAGPQRRRGGGGRLEAVAEADLAGQGHGLGAARQHRLGAEVDPRARDLAGSSLPPSRSDASSTVTRSTALQQPVGGGQSGDAAPDDHDVPPTRVNAVFAHVPTFSDPAGATAGQPGVRRESGP